MSFRMFLQFAGQTVSVLILVLFATSDAQVFGRTDPISPGSAAQQRSADDEEMDYADLLEAEGSGKEPMVQRLTVDTSRLKTPEPAVLGTEEMVNKNENMVNETDVVVKELSRLKSGASARMSLVVALYVCTLVFLF
ncbi:uncharacterized protein LOC129597290 [Paramacrobiotus metropolitanus]|uniref:uncharacterized protein LOC129597290 n=1 Tax=Paramacrobiotus metropolitanus TaxID=2943436 RepID=UPI0024455FAD|nr:uncharacterized protein LOC129597290 [Paramacrobiotus metropolitanus]